MSDKIKIESSAESPYSNLARGKTTSNKLAIISRNTFDIDVICDLIEGFDPSITSEPTENAIGIIQRLSREVYINAAGLHDTLRAGGSYE